MKKFDLSQLPSAVVGVPLQSGGATALHTGSKSSSVDPVAHGHNEQIDVNLSLANITRFTIAMFGLTAAFAAMTTEAGVRQQLQCALAAAACAVATWFYSRVYTIRRAKGIAYSRAGTAAVDSLRYSCWAVTNGVLAWLAMLLHGPFAPTESPFFDFSYRQWLRVGPILSSTAVLCSGSAQFCAESARYQGGWTRGFVAWCLLGAVFLVAAVGCASATNLTLQLDGDTSARTATEIHVGQILGRLWFVYPAVNLTKILVTYFTQHNAEELRNMMFGRAVLPVARLGEGVREALLWALRIVSSSHAYSPLPESYEDEAETSLGYALVPPVYTQLFDAVLAIVDLASIGLPALACTAMALPVSS